MRPSRRRRIGLNPRSQPWKRRHIDYPTREKKEEEEKKSSAWWVGTHGSNMKKMHLFTYSVYSAKQTRDQDYAATPTACCLLELNFKLTGSLCPLLWSFQSMHAVLPPPSQWDSRPYFLQVFSGAQRNTHLWVALSLLNIRWRHSTWLKARAPGSFAKCDCLLCGACRCLAQMKYS